ncbi:MAG: nucleotide exchange factor GrpE [Clostridia bacterium]
MTENTEQQEAMATNQEKKQQPLTQEEATEQVKQLNETIACYIAENEELIAEQDKLKKEITKSDKYLDQLVAMKNDFESYKRRIRFNNDEAQDKGKGDVIEKLIPVLDTFEIAKAHIKDEDTINAFSMILRQFEKVLQDIGVEEIETQDLPFDPTIANAITKRVTTDDKVGTVLEVYQKGYIYKGRVLRYSQVIVGDKAPEEKTN